MKVQYCDIEDQDGCGKLEEWVLAFRLAAADKLGMRCLRRPTIRPCPLTSDSVDTEFIVGVAVDAWWSDGWWEGVLTATKGDGVDNLQVYVPGENLFLNVPKKDVRVSRDWVGGKWVDVEPKLDILSVIGRETKEPEALTPVKDSKTDDEFAPETKVGENESKEADMPAPASPNGHIEQLSSPKKDDREDGDNVSGDDGNAEGVSGDVIVGNAEGVSGDDGNGHDAQNVRNGENDDQREGKSGVAEVTEAGGPSDEAAELEEVHGSDDRAITVQN